MLGSILNKLLLFSYYTNIKQGINQDEFWSFNVNLSRANKFKRVNFYSANYTRMEK